MTDVPVRLPPSPPWPQFVQDIAYLTRGLTLMHTLYERFGTAFSWHSPATVEASAIRGSDVREAEEVRPGVP